jgi:peptidyl-prolyl cis-trans isomerase C
MFYTRIIVLCTLAALAACQPKGAPSAPASTSSAASTAANSAASATPAAADSANAGPVAIVNGTPIERDAFDFYAKGLAGKSSVAEITPEQRQQALDNLVRAQVIAQEAKKEGIDKEPATASLLQLSQLNVLQQALSDRFLKDKKPTEQEVRAEYETQVGLLPHQEYHVHHILVATEGFARKLVGELEKGANFGDVAKRESMDPSKTNGGDIGWLTPDRIMKPFADAMVALKKGEYTHKPVQTQYGWHIIRLEDVRDVTPPTFDQVRQRLEQVVQAKKFKAYTDGLMKNAQIEKKI